MSTRADTLGELVDLLDDLRKKTDSAVEVRTDTGARIVGFWYDKETDAVVLETE